MIDFSLNVISKLCQVNIGRTTFKFVLHLCTREVVQHYLHHGEFI